MFLPADRVIGGGERYTAAEVAELSGVDLEFLVAARRAMGLPIPERRRGRLHRGGAGVRAHDRRPLARRASPTRTASSCCGCSGAGSPRRRRACARCRCKLVLEPGISEHELARRYARGDRAAVSAAGPADPQPADAASAPGDRRAEVVSALERSGGHLPGSREVAVCFADLVGFTRLGEEVPADELGRLAVRLEALASGSRRRRRCGWSRRSATRRCSPRRSRSRCSTRRSRLIDAADAEGEDFPQLRAGAALGLALPRAGDWFGRPVNLASRITSIARPGQPAGRARGARGGARRLPLVVRRRAPAARHPRAGRAVPRAPLGA